MIQYNLARLRSMPANQNYLDGFERMRCEAIQKDGERCKKWKEGDSAWCWEHSADNAGDAENLSNRTRHQQGPAAHE